MLSLAALKLYPAEILCFALIWSMVFYLVPQYSVTSDYAHLIWNLQQIWFLFVGSYGLPFVLIWMLYSFYGNHEEIGVVEDETDEDIGEVDHVVVIKRLEADLTSITVEHKKLRTKHGILEDSYDKQVDALTLEKAISADYCRQLEEHGMDYAEAERRVTEKLKVEHAASLQAIKESIDNKQYKTIEDLEKTHANVIEDLNKEHTHNVHAAREELEAKYRLEKSGDLATIEALQSKVQDLNHTLQTSYAEGAEQKSAIKTLKNKVQGLEDDVCVSSTKISAQFETIKALEVTVSALKDDLSAACTEVVKHVKTIKMIEDKVMRLENDVSVKNIKISEDSVTIKALEKKSSDLERNSIQGKAKFPQLLASIETLKDRVEELEIDLSARNDMIGATVNGLKTKENAIESLEKKIAKANKKAGKAEEAVRAAEAELKMKDAKLIRTTILLSNAKQQVEAFEVLLQAINKRK